MSLPDSVREQVETALGTPVQRASPVGGGCIAHATRIETAAGPFFLKWAEGDAGASFAAEADGLAALRAARDLSGADLVIPDVLGASDAADRPGFLLQEWIETGRPDDDAWTGFGRALAALHAAPPPTGPARYGFHRDNRIGATPQANGWLDAWPAFFRSRRLEPQIALPARTAGGAPAGTARPSGCWAGWKRCSPPIRLPLRSTAISGAATRSRAPAAGSRSSIPRPTWATPKRTSP